MLYLNSNTFHGKAWVGGGVSDPRPPPVSDEALPTQKHKTYDISRRAHPVKFFFNFTVILVIVIRAIWIV